MAPKIETLRDNFAVQDSNKWDYGSHASIVSDQLRLESRADYAGVVAGRANGTIWDFVNSSVICEFIGFPTNPVTGTTFGINTYDDTEGFRLRYANGNIFFHEYTTGGGGDETWLSYNATDHRWWRMRENAGTVYWETSPTGDVGSWTVRRSKSWAVAQITSVYPFFDCGGIDDAASVAVFDNFNTPPLRGGFFALMQ